LILGTFFNQGNIQVNSGGGSNTELILPANTTLQGGCTVTLANSGGTGTSFISAQSSGLTLTNVDNTIQGAGTIRGTGGGPVMQLVNQSAGTILANTPGQTLAMDFTTITNAGTLRVGPGSTMQVNMTPGFVLNQTGGMTELDHGTLILTQGESVSGGSVLGTGLIQGNVTLTGGTMQPGGSGTPGLLFIEGNFTHSGALFNELIGSGANGLLFINGASSLGPGSMLNIDLLNNFKPFSGEMFTIMDFTSGSGIFANALPMTDFQMDGYNWSVEYFANSIVLDAGAPVTSTNVPEPNSLLLLSTGLTVLAGSLWKKREAAKPE
jgi:hypothetical protein